MPKPPNPDLGAEKYPPELPPRINALADVIDADGRLDLAHIDGAGDKDLREVVSKALLGLLASVNKVRSARWVITLLHLWVSLVFAVFRVLNQQIFFG